MTYRKRKGKDTWHWRPDCSLWPTKGYTISKKKPTNGELCNQCRAKTKRRAGK